MEAERAPTVSVLYDSSTVYDPASAVHPDVWKLLNGMGDSQ